MQMQFDQGRGLYIQSYDDQSLSIDDAKFDKPLIISPKSIIKQWDLKGNNRWVLDDFTAIEDLNKLEILLLGKTHQTHLPALEIIAHYSKLRIGVEIMPLGAACRTYNILMSEERRVAACLLLHSSDD